MTTRPWWKWSDADIRAARRAEAELHLPSEDLRRPIGEMRATVQALDDELVNARVWIGFHFRNSVVAGENLGNAVANWELQRNFQPTGEDGN